MIAKDEPIAVPRFFVPETVQTSAMDCGPAALKCLLEGFGIPASYGRLREACQTDVDGTSINTLEDVAQRLGLHAEQMMAPPDHLLLSTARLLPALVVTTLPNGFNHFVIVWRTHGPFVQIMDPAVGRRWMTQRRFLNEVYRYTVPFSAATWRAWADTTGFIDPLNQRLGQVGLPNETAADLLQRAATDASWRSFATLDAVTRLTTSVVQAKGILHGTEATRLLVALFDKALRQENNVLEIIPAPFWSVQPLAVPPADATPASNPDSAPDTLLLMRGAVLLNISGATRLTEAPPPAAPTATAPDRTDTVANSNHTGEDDSLVSAEDKHTAATHSSILSAALHEHTKLPEWELYRALRDDGLLKPALLISAATLAALAITAEAALLRGLMVLAADLQLGLWRLALIGELTAFVILLLALEFPIASGVLQMGRQLETRIRMAFLAKIPRLSDRYFHSRLISDMTQRAYGLHQLHSLPDLALRLLRILAQLIFTTAGIIWIYPNATPFALLALAGVLASALLSQPIQSERDMRIRTHTGALSRFYLDALMGLLPIRTHSAERTMRREHEMLLVAWARESMGLVRIEALAQSVAALLGLGFAIAIVLSFVISRGESSSVLLLLYWALNLPALGQSLATSARQYPMIRNQLQRILEPLGAPEEGVTAQKMAAQSATTLTNEQEEQQSTKINPAATVSLAARGVALQFNQVAVQAGGHAILSDINLTIRPGEHVAIVGTSGAGKSTLLGLLLGWHYPASGQLLIDGEPLVDSHISQLRRATAWVDPSIQLWNRPLQENLRYGNNSGPQGLAEQPIGVALAGADLYEVLERLPNGLQTRLGEGGGLVSGGEGQRVRLGRALLRNGVRLALLDEPFRGLDRTQRRTLLANARQQWQAATLLCATHDIAETTNFARVLVVDGGKIIEDGSPKALLRQPQSHYHALFTADETVYRRRWGATTWRRLRLDQGQLQQKRFTAKAQSSSAQRDELRQIKGIGPIWAKRLQQAGIQTLEELATADVSKLTAQLTAAGHKAPTQLSAWIQAAARLVQTMPAASGHVAADSAVPAQTEGDQ